MNLQLQLVVAVAFGAILSWGCERDNMWTQAKVRPLGEAQFFADGRAARKPVEGTIATGAFNADKLLSEGMEHGKLAARFPNPVTEEILEFGKKRYAVLCTNCHGTLGDGVAIVPQRGYQRPTPFTSARLLNASPGFLFMVMRTGVKTNPNPYPEIIAGTGFDLRDVVHPVLGRMLKPKEKWAVVAWIRVLQVSQSFSAKDLTADEKTEISISPTGGK